MFLISDVYTFQVRNVDSGEDDLDASGDDVAAAVSRVKPAKRKSSSKLANNGAKEPKPKESEGCSVM